MKYWYICALKFTMRFIAILIPALLLFASCKKKDKSEESTTTPSTPANGTFNIAIASYDSIGGLEAKVLNTSVFLSGTSYSATPDTNGFVSFSVPPGQYFPSIVRSNYEGSPFFAVIGSNNTTNASAIVARNSPWALQIANGQSFNPDSVTLSMNLNKPVPAGKLVKVAVIFAPTPPVTVHSYSVCQEFYLSQANNPNFNVCKGAIKAAIASLPSGVTTSQPFYLLAVPVSYGNYYSSFLAKNVLLGDNLPTTSMPTATIGLSKTW